MGLAEVILELLKHHLTICMHQKWMVVMSVTVIFVILNK